ncbi:unnamed protein product [Peniophora sp. CBMAI 1063]|nr:unnamed protein product [Peniophora sp. CBMAI 1063]
MASTRQQRASQQSVLEAARWGAHCSREEPGPANAPMTNASRSEGPTIPTSGARYHRARAPRPAVRTASVVGIGCDMIFAPVGCFSTPRVIHMPDTRPIDWMFTSFDELKPLAVVREELRQAVMRCREAEHQMFGSESARLVGIGGRRLYPGEAPPF